MKELINEVKPLIRNEYARASEEFGPVNHSDHESMAIISEELEEARDQLSYCSDDILKFWKCTKDKDAVDSDKLNALDKLYTDALLAACEFIQVAAMAHKARLTIEERKKE